MLDFTLPEKVEKLKMICSNGLGSCTNFQTLRLKLLILSVLDLLNYDWFLRSFVKVVNLFCCLLASFWLLMKYLS